MAVVSGPDAQAVRGGAVLQALDKVQVDVAVFELVDARILSRGTGRCAWIPNWT